MTFVRHLTFVWYAGSLLGNHVRAIISLLDPQILSSGGAYDLLIINPNKTGIFEGGFFWVGGGGG